MTNLLKILVVVTSIIGFDVSRLNASEPRTPSHQHQHSSHAAHQGSFLNRGMSTDVWYSVNLYWRGQMQMVWIADDVAMGQLLIFVPADGRTYRFTLDSYGNLVPVNY